MRLFPLFFRQKWHFLLVAVFARSSFRHSFIPHKRTDGLGFRIVRKQ
jgi:formylglycine-generating enzyme required for sulfatase activity